MTLLARSQETEDFAMPFEADADLSAVFDPAPRLCAGCMEVEIPDDKRYCSTNCFRQEDGEDRDDD